MSTTDIERADQLEGSPHPREATKLWGHDHAQAEFLEAYNEGRLHHAWLISGRRGIGKATLAWRIAKFLLAQPERTGLFGDDDGIVNSLDSELDAPAVRRALADAEPRLFVLRRPWDPDAKRLKREIPVDEARKLKNFFALTSAEGGRKVVIVDSADELNRNAANALLKILEEPPEGAVLLLISHQPSRLLPTIRSRCRNLRLGPLTAADMSKIAPDSEMFHESLAELAGGSAGNAMRLNAARGMETYAELVGLFSRLPQFDRAAALVLAESASGRASDGRFDLLVELIERLVSRLARTGAGHAPIVAAAPDEIVILSRLSPSAEAARKWAELQLVISDRVRRGRAVNLDPAALILDALFKINETGAELVRN